MYRHEDRVREFQSKHNLLMGTPMHTVWGVLSDPDLSMVHSDIILRYFSVLRVLEYGIEHRHALSNDELYGVAGRIAHFAKQF